jgi:hypothetical protein
MVIHLAPRLPAAASLLFNVVVHRDDLFLDVAGRKSIAFSSSRRPCLTIIMPITGMAMRYRRMQYNA